MLKKRKEVERKLISEMEKNNELYNDKWYAVSIDWIKKWKAFVNGNAGDPG